MSIRVISSASESKSTKHERKPYARLTERNRLKHSDIIPHRTLSRGVHDTTESDMSGEHTTEEMPFNICRII